MRTLAVANAKGGAGKTSTSVHLATGLALDGHRVLLVDLDPQHNATLWLVGKHNATPELPGAFELITGQWGPNFGGLSPIELCYELEERPGLYLSPANRPKMSKADREIAAQTGGQMILRGALEELVGDFDYVVLDCPPDLDLITLSAFCAADAVLAPVEPGYLSLAGLQELEDAIANTRNRLRVPVELLGYFLFKADRRERATHETRAVLAERAGSRLFHAAIWVSAEAKSVSAAGRVAWDKGADRRGRNDYRALLEETLERLDSLAPALVDLPRRTA